MVTMAAKNSFNVAEAFLHIPSCACNNIHDSTVPAVWLRNIKDVINNSPAQEPFPKPDDKLHLLSKKIKP